MSEVWVGMPVIDADGTVVGTVKQIRAVVSDSDPSGAPIRSDDAATRSLTEFVQVAGAAVAGRLLLKVTGAGLMDNDCYVRAEQIATVDDENVHLSVTAADLTVERWLWI